MNLFEQDEAVIDNSSRFDVARRQAEDLLAQFKSAEQVNIVRGALASLYNRDDEKQPSDALLWAAGQDREDGGREQGVGNLLIALLRREGVIDYAELTDDGLFFWNRKMFGEE